MTNLYLIQSVGIFLVVAGFAGLSASAYVFGKPLTRDEQKRMNRAPNTYRLPIKLETVASAAFILSGLGLLAWSKFNVCAYLAYWLPNLSEPIRFWLAC